MNTALFLADSAPQGGGMSFIIMMVAIFAIMYFFMIRPQQKKQKEIRKFQNALDKGSCVVTGGGLYGTVKEIDLANNIVILEISKGVTVKVDKSYVFPDASASSAAQAK